MNDRLFAFIESTGLSTSDFADAIGISRSSISSIKSGRTQLTLSIVEKIKAVYSDLNLEWMITGKGIMINRNGANEQQYEQNDDDLEFGKSEAADNAPPAYVQNSLFPDVERGKERAVVDTARQNTKTRYSVDKSIRKIIVLYNDGTFDEFDKD